jgi:hypothetical protein
MNLNTISFALVGKANNKQREGDKMKKVPKKELDTKYNCLQPLAQRARGVQFGIP